MGSVSAPRSRTNRLACPLEALLQQAAKRRSRRRSLSSHGTLATGPRCQKRARTRFRSSASPYVGAQCCGASSRGLCHSSSVFRTPTSEEPSIQAATMHQEFNKHASRCALGKPFELPRLGTDEIVTVTKVEVPVRERWLRPSVLADLPASEKSIGFRRKVE